MLPRESSEKTSKCRKLQPQAKLPRPAVLRSLAGDDVSILKTLVSERVEYIENDFFECAAAERMLMGPLAKMRPANPEKPGQNDDSGVYRLDESDEPLTKDERELHLFLRLNFCRCRVLQMLERHKGVRLGADAVRDLLVWEQAALDARSELVRENIPLVLAMAKRTRIVGVDLTDLISEGNLALLRSVVKFDCARGYKFSTYACRAILKSFSRVATRNARYRGHFPTEFDPELERGDYVEQRRLAMKDDCISEVRLLVDDNTAQLSDVERKVIRARFALDEDASDEALRKAKTLEQVGQMIGVTKERVRQIQNKALGKLRVALEEGILAR